jgi:hypothetical protein
MYNCLINRDSMFWLTFSTWPVWNVLPHYCIGCRSGLLITSVILIHSYIQYYILLKSMHGELGCHQRKEGLIFIYINCNIKLYHTFIRITFRIHLVDIRYRNPHHAWNNIVGCQKYNKIGLELWCLKPVSFICEENQSNLQKTPTWQT